MREKDNHPVRLTFRQKAFMRKFLEIYRQMQVPLHYSIVAERMGLSNSTAYDILKVLEQKGVVVSEYGTPKVASGPGRSNILFSPAAGAGDLFPEPSAEKGEDAGWKEAKERIIGNLQQGKNPRYEKLFRELLTRLSGASSPLVHCAEYITTLLLALRKTEHSFEQQSRVGRMLQAQPDRMGMSSLAGIALGLCLADRKTRHRFTDFNLHMKKYENSLQELSQENLSTLHRFTLDVWNLLYGMPA